MNGLSIIEQRQVLGKDFKIYGTYENPLFLAKDVARWIEYSESNVSKLVNIVDDNEKVRNIITTLGGNQESWFLTEDGLYEVLMQSRKSIAKQFKKQVKEILKDVRRYGMYANTNTLESLINNPDTLIEILTKYKDEKAKTKALELEIEEQRPKVIFADAVKASKNSLLVGEVAKILRQNGIDMGQNRFFKWLRDNGFLISRKGSDYNMPTQYSMELGLFEIKETTITHSEGHITISKTPKITGKGQVYFINKFKNIA